MAFHSFESPVIESIGILVPHKEPEITRALDAVRDGCQLALTDALDAQDVGVNRKDVSLQVFDCDYDLPTDIVSIYTMEPNLRLREQLFLIGAIRNVLVVNLFSVVKLDSDWLQNEVFKPAGMSIDDLDLTINTYDIPTLNEKPVLITYTMENIGKKALKLNFESGN